MSVSSLSRPQSRVGPDAGSTTFLTEADAGDYDYSDEFELADEEEEEEDKEEMNEAPSSSFPSSTVDPSVSTSLVVAPKGDSRTHSRVVSRSSGAPSSLSRRTVPHSSTLYALEPRRRGQSDLRADSSFYNTSLLGGVPPSWPTNSPLGVVLCERAVDVTSKRAHEQAMRLATLKAQDAARVKLAEEMELKSRLHVEATAAVEAARRAEREAHARTRAEVRAAAKEFELRRELRRSDAYAASLSHSHADQAASAAASARHRARRIEVSEERAQVRDKQKQSLLLQKLTTEARAQADLALEQAAKKRDPTTPMGAALMAAAATAEDEKQNDDEDAASANGHEGGSPRRTTRAPRSLSPFKPASPLHSSRAVPVEDHSPSLRARLAQARVDWPSGMDTRDPVVPRRDLRAADDRRQVAERALADLAARDQRQARRATNLARTRTDANATNGGTTKPSNGSASKPVTVAGAASARTTKTGSTSARVHHLPPATSARPTATSRTATTTSSATSPSTTATAATSTASRTHTIHTPSAGPSANNSRAVSRAHSPTQPDTDTDAATVTATAQPVPVVAPPVSSHAPSANDSLDQSYGDDEFDEE